MRGALVLGGDYRALGAVRSLGRRGIPVWVIRARQDHRLAALSRYAARDLLWPDEEDEARRQFLLDLAERQGTGGWVLFPTADVTAAFVAREHDALARCYRLTTPCWDSFRWAHDKRETAELARRLGIASPRTTPVLNRADVAGYAGPFPVILKPAVRHHLGRPTTKAWPAGDRDALLAAWEVASRAVAPGALLLQELVPGTVGTQYSFAAVCEEGRPTAAVVAERVRQHPPDFGRSSTYVRTLDDPAVEAAGRRILQALRAVGPVEVEFKRDARDGCLRLLDINMRIWGWHTIGRRTGFDVAYLAWRLAAGEPVEEMRAAEGLRWLRLSTDVLAAARMLRDGELSAGAWLRSLVLPHERPVAALDDPLPALTEGPDLLLQRSGGRRQARQSGRAPLRQMIGTGPS